jgi:tRNA pseudouridine38-40 synthase
MRYKCTCRYDGALFHGFQIQKNARSVQEEIERALLLIFKKPTRIHPAGRTDTGVHALGQVFHFDADLEIKTSSLIRAMNSRLPEDVHITAVERANDDFHARYSAKSKEYHYILDFGTYNPLFRNYRHYYRYPRVDYRLFEEAMLLFVGRHDFRYFSRSKAAENTTREIYRVGFEWEGSAVKVIIVGNGFLHNMIRIIIATALEVARGKKTLDDIRKSLAGKAPLPAPKKLPPNGLYLVKIDY